MLGTKQILHKDKLRFSPNNQILHFLAQYVSNAQQSKNCIFLPQSFLSLLKSQKHCWNASQINWKKSEDMRLFF